MSTPRRCPRCQAEIVRPPPKLLHTPQWDAEGNPVCAHTLWSDPDCPCGWSAIVERYLGLHPHCPQREQAI